MDSAYFQRNRGYVLLLEPNAALRSAVHTLLEAEGFHTELVDTLEDVMGRAHRLDNAVALVAWQTMQGLLNEEHRHNLLDLTRRVRLIVMVPRRWEKLLESTDLSTSVAGIVAKPFEADELIAKLDMVLATPTPVG